MWRKTAAKVSPTWSKLIRLSCAGWGPIAADFIVSLVSIAITCTYAAARAAAFAKNDLWEHYHMIRRRKRPNAKEAKTLKVLSEFKRSGFSSWKTSGNHLSKAWTMPWR